MSEQPLTLRPEQAAQQLSISRATMYRLGRSGEVPCVRVGKAIRFTRAALLDYIARQEATSAAAFAAQRQALTEGADAA